MSGSVSIEEVLKSHGFDLVINNNDEHEIQRPAKKLLRDEVKIGLYLLGILILIVLFYYMGGKALIFGVIAFIISLNDLTKSKSKSAGDKIIISKYGISIRSKKANKEIKSNRIEEVYAEIVEGEYGHRNGVVGIKENRIEKIVLLTLEESELDFLKKDLNKIKAYIEEQLNS